MNAEFTVLLDANNDSKLEQYLCLNQPLKVTKYTLFDRESCYHTHSGDVNLIKTMLWYNLKHNTC